MRFAIESTINLLIYSILTGLLLHYMAEGKLVDREDPVASLVIVLFGSS